MGSPLQRMAMGLVIVFGSALFPANPSPSWETYDALANPLGWVLVLSGAIVLTRAEPAFATSRTLAALAGLVSVPLWLPQISHRLDESGQWFASLPQLAFCLWLAREIGVRGGQQKPADGYVAKRFGLLVWGFALTGLLPVLVFGGGIEQLEETTGIASVVVNIAFVYFLFRVHRREWLGGPGPLEIRPVRQE